MKHILHILLLLLTLPALAQVPAGYEKEYRAAERRAAELRKDYDIVLDPVVPMLPSEYSAQAGGNWGNQYLGVTAAAETIRNRGARKVAVFVFDTGGNWDHPDLQRFAWPSFNRTFTGEADPTDRHGHSTHVAGIYGAINNAYELGLNRHLVELNMVKGIAYKVLNNSGAGQIAWIVAGTEEADRNAITLMMQGWFVIYNYSLGAGGINEQLNAVMKKSEDLGVFVVAAAGNNGGDAIGTPANAPSAHAIGALEPNGSRAPYSSYGAKLYGAAPGSRILSTWAGGILREASGTSMGAPSFGAMVAITAAIFPGTTNRQISRYIAKFATDLQPTGWDPHTGFGAPILPRLIAGNPATEPNTGNGNPLPPSPPGGTPTKDKRTVTVELQEEFKILWKPFNSTSPNFSTAYVTYTIETSTNLYAPDVYDKALATTRKYFSNRGFLLRSTDDFLDAGHWSRHFYEMHNKEYKITHLSVRDESNRTGPVPRPGALALRARHRAAEIKSLTGNWIQ